MKKANYPQDRLQEITWFLKAEWEEYVRTGAVTAALAAAAIFTGESSRSGLTPSSPLTVSGYSWAWFLSLCAAVYLATSWVSITKDAKRRRYDVTIALKYTDIFFKDIAAEKRTATEALIKFHSGSVKWKDFDQRCEVDPVLDVLDDLGFLLQGDQISDWVVYQYFSYWVQLYFEASKDYIELRRSEDTTLWEHIPDLYDDMMVIQSHKTVKPKSELIFGDGLLQLLKDENSMRS